MEGEREERRRELAVRIGWAEPLVFGPFDNFLKAAARYVYRRQPHLLLKLPGNTILTTQEPDFLDPELDVEQALSLINGALDVVNRLFRPAEDSLLLAEKWVVLPRISLEEISFLSCGIDPDESLSSDVNYGFLHSFHWLIRDHALLATLDPRLVAAKQWGFEMFGDEGHVKKPTSKDAWIWLKDRAKLGGWALPPGLVSVFSRLDQTSDATNEYRDELVSETHDDEHQQKDPRVTEQQILAILETVPLKSNISSERQRARARELQNHVIRLRAEHSKLRMRDIRERAGKAASWATGVPASTVERLTYSPDSRGSEAHTAMLQVRSLIHSANQSSADQALSRSE